MTSAPPINEAVALLDRFSPNTLITLRAELPELGGHLEAGGLAGPADPLVVARAKVCIATIEELDILCQKGVKVAEQRLGIQKRFVLIGGITAAIASASVIASLSAKYPTIAFVGGLVSLGGSLAALLADHIGKVPNDTMSLFEAYQELVVMRSDSRILLMQLSTQISVGAQNKDEKEIADLIGKCNEICRRAYQLFAVLEIASKQSEPH